MKKTVIKSNVMLLFMVHPGKINIQHNNEHAAGAGASFMYMGAINGNKFT